METLFKTEDVEVTRSKRGTISFACNDKTSAMFDLFTRITELEEQLQNTVNDRNEAWLQLEANNIEIKPVSTTLSVWTIYKNPIDYPDKYVARRFELDLPTNEHKADTSLSVVRDWIAESAINQAQGIPVRMERNVCDNPVILETWV